MTLIASEDLRMRIRDLLGRYPEVAIPLYRRRRKTRALTVGPATDVVIEGFPRSGNTFAVHAFRTAQPQPTEVAHHLHLAAQVLWGLERNIPAIVLIRQPVDAIASLLIRTGDSVPVAAAARSYGDFYERILPVRDRITLCRFEDLTSDYGAVIKQLNAQAGTDFVPFDHSPENVARCFAEIDAMNERDTSRRDFVGGEHTVARPSEERKAIAEEVKARIAADPAMGRALRAYETMTNAS